jgi:hypothetical protein
LAHTPVRSRRYIAGMSEQMRFVPPSVDFDLRLANELARHEAMPPVVDDKVYEVGGRRDPFNFYVRILTPQGGILILYKDQYRSLLDRGDLDRRLADLL